MICIKTKIENLIEFNGIISNDTLIFAKGGNKISMRVNQKAYTTKKIIACILLYTADYQNAIVWLYDIANEK